MSYLCSQAILIVIVTLGTWWYNQFVAIDITPQQALCFKKNKMVAIIIKSLMKLLNEV